MKNKEEKIKYINNLKKEEEIHKLLDELLPNLGFSDVTITHERGNAPENGKDLICSKIDELENKKDWFAFVVKKGKIAGTSNAINEVESQVKDCFKYEYKSLQTTKDRVRINKVKVVTNQHFSSGAETKILQNQELERANVDFWDAEKLVSYLDEYYSSFWQKGSASYKKYIEVFQERITYDDFSKRLGLSDEKIKKLTNLTMTPTLLEKEEDAEGRIIYKQKQINSVIQVPSNTFIIGEPGSGKSTLFRILSKEIIEQNALRSDLEFYPIIITFSQILGNDFSIKKSLQWYFSNEYYKHLNIDIDSILQQKQCVIFIDALDEIASNKDKETAFESIKTFSVDYPEIKIICTSRPSDFLSENCHEKNGFRSLKLDDVNRQAMMQYINSFFNDNISKSKKLIKSLQDTGLLDKLPKTPLTIALITIIFDEREVEIPSTITDLYQLFVDLLLKKFEVKSTIDILETNIKHRLLSNLAKEMHFRRITSVSFDAGLVIVTKYFEERGYKGLSSSDVLIDIIDNSGLLYYNDKNELQFKHLSFQEFFTAHELYNHRQAERDIFIDNFNNLWWQNVAIFYAGFSKDAPLLLDSIIEKSQPKTFEEKVNNIAGIGRLMQALYSTPIENRVSGLMRTTQSSYDLVDFLIQTDEKKFDFFKKYSRYIIYQMLLGWFNLNHHSITLLEPIRMAFDKQLDESNNLKAKGETFSIEEEYKLLLLASAIGNSSFVDFSKYKILIENSKTSDLSLIALQEMWFRINYKELDKESQQIEDIDKLKKALSKKMRNLGNISENVNKSIKEE